MNAIELLAPAKNLQSGIVAINYGADAVYIGADRFGARAAAANSVADIETLVQYAHKYKAKVFVTLNTILYDHELEEAEKLIHQIYHAGADALIIQDMGILRMKLPPIPLHASTQTNNYDPERIRFFDELGFERIVLARELSLNEIRNIRSQTKTALEFFVHGSLCVSLSGQCYFSQAVTGRSANRGMCAQMCGHPYNLIDGEGNKIILNSHLLSLKDLNLSNHLKELIDAGITNLKIEGRLKEGNYVKNVVSYYRRKLDEIFASGSDYKKPSSGKTQISFEPDPEKSFSRGGTNYFLSGRKKNLINKYSPKSMGKKLGIVDQVGSDFITVTTNEILHNGDGLCFIFKDDLIGFRVEKVLDKKIVVNELSHLSHGTELYRNYDHEFNKILEADNSIRKVSATINVTEQDKQLEFKLCDEDHLNTVHIVNPLPEIAKDPEQAAKNLVIQLAKAGSSMFDIKEVLIDYETDYFIRISELNEIRRTLFEKHEKLRILTFARNNSKAERKSPKFSHTKVGFSENISNQKAILFYKEHGVENLEEALEISTVKEDQLLMTTRYCIKHELGFCEKLQLAKKTLPEPLYLEDQNRKYLLTFDCKHCLMQVRLNKNISLEGKSEKYKW
ncbi:MAG: collagenase-like protease [Bacteroidetes bacterium HGW-Bacteroidetes-17]|nr:MAG: collagenase-like protease [Bacteroidetes bacterium HGW-Bacteroidetes-17]